MGKPRKPDQSSAAPAGPEKTYDETVARLADLPTDEYERVRKDEAKRFGMRSQALDDDVKRRRKAGLVARAREQSRADLGLDEALEEWLDPVDGAALLGEIHKTLREFVIMDDSALVGITLWVVFTHLLENESVVTSPRLAILSPEKQCGKTRLLEIIGKFVFRPILASNISPSVVYRALEICPMTMLIDEADSFIRDLRGNFNQELRGVLNSGHTRTSAYVMRSVLGDDKNWTPKNFSTWGAFAVAAIGDLPDTWLDRSITIKLKRKLRGEKVRRFRKSDKKLNQRLSQIAQRIRRWVKDNAAAVAGTRFAPLKEFSDRAADNWETLFAIAGVAGGPWLERARTAAVELSGRADTDSLKTMLLNDLRLIFAQVGDRILSRDLCLRLHAMEGRPWAEYRRGAPITKNQVAGLLKGFQIYSTALRVKVGGKPDELGNGYKARDCADAFKRYLPAVASEETTTEISEPSLNGDDPQQDRERLARLVASQRPARPR